MHKIQIVIPKSVTSQQNKQTCHLTVKVYQFCNISQIWGDFQSLTDFQVCLSVRGEMQIPNLQSFVFLWCYRNVKNRTVRQIHFKCCAALTHLTLQSRHSTVHRAHYCREEECLPVCKTDVKHRKGKKKSISAPLNLQEHSASSESPKINP